MGNESNVEITPKEVYDAMMELKSEMVETRQIIKQYNGLRQIINDTTLQVGTLANKVSAIEARNNAITWSVGIGISLITVIIGFIYFLDKYVIH